MTKRASASLFNKKPLAILGCFLIPVITLMIGYQLGKESTIRPLSQAPPSTLQLENGADSNAIDLNIAGSSRAQIAQEPQAPFSLDKLNRVFDIVSEHFLYSDRLKIPELSIGAIIGMVQALDDRYTVFFGEDENAEFQNELRGEIEGIGAYLTSKRGNLEVISVLKGTPAMQAGVLPGDIIVKIENEYATDLFFHEAISRIRGPKGTSVNLEIQRTKKGDNKLGETNEIIKKSIVRDTLNIESVTWEEKEPGIIYLSINHFTAKTVSEFRRVVAEVVLKSPRGIVLDLRFNPGGFMDAAIRIASEFVEEGVIVIRKDKEGREEIASTSIPTWPTLPLVVLINKGSASASEIVASALQDNSRAELVGETSFGKGSIQETFPFADGTMLKMTTAIWLTPNGVNVEDIGIAPDHIVEAGEKDIFGGEDQQLDKAIEILKGKIKS